MAQGIAITGASGFLGSYLFRYLGKAGLNVVGYSRSNLPDLTHVSNYSEIANADIIVHCAETNKVAKVERLGETYMQEAIGLTKSLLSKTDRMIYASSALVYGTSSQSARRIDEEISTNNIYSSLKLECETLVEESCGVSLRLANLCGPNQPEGTILADILAQKDTAGPVKLRNTAAFRDFIWLADVANAVLRITKKTDLSSVLNIGSGKGMSVGEFAIEVSRALGRQNINVISEQEPREDNLYLDISETVKLLDWKPELDIEHGVKSLFEVKN